MHTDEEAQRDEIASLATALGKTIIEHCGNEVDVYALLTALAIVAGEVISQAPIQAREELLAAWDEVPRYTRDNLKPPN